MSEVTVPFGENAQETATLLLAAAEEAGQEAYVVRTSEGAFLVPEEIAKKAKVDYESDDDSDDAEATPKKAAKKAAK